MQKTKAETVLHYTLKARLNFYYKGLGEGVAMAWKFCSMFTYPYMDASQKNRLEQLHTPRH